MTIFSGKVYTVTGAASGMGRATSVRLAELGAKGLAISDVNLVGLEETAKLCKQSHLDLPLLNTTTKST